MKTKIIRLEEIDSTNRYLKNYREEGDEEMIVAVADYQSAGKGQGTHTWESEKGKNLLFSIKVYPHWIPVRRQFVLSAKADNSNNATAIFIPDSMLFSLHRVTYTGTKNGMRRRTDPGRPSYVRRSPGHHPS